MDNHLLERAIQIAVQAHAGQVDKSGALYILHPLRVMFRLTTLAERIVGALHDVVEDTGWTQVELGAEGFPAEVLEALDSVTPRRAEETYEEFIFRAKANPIGRQVKLADLEDNMDLRRIASLEQKDLERLVKYRKAWSQLSEEH